MQVNEDLNANSCLSSSRIIIIFFSPQTNLDTREIRDRRRRREDDMRKEETEEKRREETGEEERAGEERIKQGCG